MSIYIITPLYMNLLIETAYYLILFYDKIKKIKKVGENMELSIEQKNAINHVEGPALILAVPGAGKTTVLIHRTDRKSTRLNSSHL